MEEIWKDIKGYEGYYEVSNNGAIRSVDRIVKHYCGDHVNKLLLGKMKHQVSVRGYLKVCLCKNGKQKNHFTHRLLAESFLSNPDNKPQVNHINGIKSDNRVENLEWCTSSENVLHSWSTGLSKAAIGNQLPQTKLSSDEVLAIKKMLKLGYRPIDIHNKNVYDCGYNNIKDIAAGKIWKHIKLTK